MTYHRFPPATTANLESHCAYLRRHYHPLPLSALVAGLRGELRLPPRAVAITIDDGYRDIYDIAFPIFLRHRIPFTVFVTTGFVDRRLWLWVDQVRYAVEQSSLAAIEWEQRHLSLATVADRAEAIVAIKESLKTLPDDQRRSLLLSLPNQLQVSLPPEAPAPYAPLSWEQVREMHSHGAAFGAHTVSHPVLSRIVDPVRRQHEIAGAKQRLEAQLQEPVEMFCYPNGRFVDIGSETKAAVQTAGFTSAVTTEAGVNVPGGDPYLLRRLSVDAADDPYYFRERVAALRLR